MSTSLDWIVLTILNGMSLGGIYFTLAVGLSLTLGIMGVVNLSHGAFFMLGGYVGWFLAVSLGLNYGLAVLAGGLVAGLVGLAIQQGLLRYLYGKQLEQAVLTAGFIYIITNVVLWIWGPSYRAPFTASALSGSFTIVGWNYPIHRLITIAVSLLLFAGLWWLNNKTRIGAIVRAGMDDKQMTMVLGINLERVSYFVFFLGAFLAGVGGVIGAQMMALNLDMGFNILLLSLIVVIIGGTGSVEGAFCGAMLIGIIDAIGRILFPELAAFTMYLILLIMLLIRPAGLIPRK